MGRTPIPIPTPTPIEDATRLIVRRPAPPSHDSAKSPTLSLQRKTGIGVGIGIGIEEAAMQDPELYLKDLLESLPDMKEKDLKDYTPKEWIKRHPEARVLPLK